MGLYFAPHDSEGHRVAVRHYARRQATIEVMFQQAVAQHGNLRGRQERYAVTLIGMLNSYLAIQLDGRLMITDKLRRAIVHQFSHGIYS